MITMFFPSMAGLAPIWSAAATAAPEEIPQGIPSMRAISRAVSKEGWLPIFTTSSMTERSRIEGMKFAPMP